MKCRRGFMLHVMIRHSFITSNPLEKDPHSDHILRFPVLKRDHFILCLLHAVQRAFHVRRSSRGVLCLSRCSGCGRASFWSLKKRHAWLSSHGGLARDLEGGAALSDEISAQGTRG